LIVMMTIINQNFDLFDSFDCDDDNNQSK